MQCHRQKARKREFSLWIERKLTIVLEDFIKGCFFNMYEYDFVYLDWQFSVERFNILFYKQNESFVYNV